MKGYREETRTDGRTSFLLDVMEPAGIEGIDMEELLHQSADILEHFPGCFYVCRAQQPWAVLYANRELLDFLECQDIEEWRRYIHNNTENMLVFEDRQRVLAEIRKQRLAGHAGPLCARPHPSPHAHGPHPLCRAFRALRQDHSRRRGLLLPHHRDGASQRRPCHRQGCAGLRHSPSR